MKKNTPILLTQQDFDNQSLPHEARLWLQEQNRIILSYYKDYFIVTDAESSSIIQRYMDDGKIDALLDVASDYLIKNNILSSVIINTAYPFLCANDIQSLRKGLDSGMLTLITAYDKKIVVLAICNNYEKRNYCSVSELRSLRVTTTMQWLIAKNIRENWPLFYFNDEYRDYWLVRAEKSSTADKIVCDDIFYSIFIRAIAFIENNNGRLLDAGCGHGRFFSIFEQAGFTVTGVDIAWETVTALNKDNINNVFQGTIENTLMPESNFSFVNAWGVFDCTDQSQSLHHLLGRLEIGGVLLLSGKNDTYFSDDALALEAELNAACKNFPNGFTDFFAFEEAVGVYGGMISECYFGLYRGDMAKGIWVTEKPPCFYDWVVVIKKISPTPGVMSCPNLSRSHSKVFYATK